MKLDELIALLHTIPGVEVEVRYLPDGTQIIIASCSLPQFPYGGRHVWYPLILPPGKNIVDQAEINALARHLCHAESKLFKP